MTIVAELSDEMLVNRLSARDEHALAEIYRRHGGAIWSLARQVVRLDALADDVTQDVFVRLWNEPGRFDPDRGSLRSFLNSLAHHRAIDLVRAESSRFRREATDARRTATRGYDLERHLDDIADAHSVREALQRLPARERDAINLAYFEGFTYREIATLQGEPEGTVKGRIRSGLKRLRVMLYSLDPDAVGDVS
jgi:RNA polymerase sigma-70 factor (ECF subfamily)